MRNLTPEIKSGLPSSWYGGIEATVTIDHDSLVKYKALVNAIAPDEVQWYSMVNRAVIPAKAVSGHLSPEVWNYYVNGIFIPKQTVSAGEVDTQVKSDPSTMMCIYEEMKAQYADDSEMGFDYKKVNSDIERMHVWCHSHPFSDNPGPSGTDINTFRKWVNDNAEQNIDTPTLMLIFGKADYVFAAVYDPRLPGSYFEEVPVLVSEPANVDKSYIEAAVKDKIVRKSFKGFPGISKSWIKLQNGTYQHSVNLTTQSMLPEPSPESLEEKAFRFFSKKCPEFQSNVNFINENYSCNQELSLLWKDLCKYLNGDVEKTLFIRALTEDAKSLSHLEPGFGKSWVCTDSEATLVLGGYATSVTLDAYEMKIAITFAKHYVSQKTNAGRKSALSTLETNQNAYSYECHTEWSNEYQYSKHL